MRLSNTQEIKKITNLLRKHDWNPYSYGLTSEMRRRGYRKILSSGVAFIGKQFVIKMPLFCQESKPRRAIPTLKLNKSSSYKSDEYVWVAQPKARCISEKKWKQLDNEGLLDDDFGTDNHSGNLGYYQGKLVAIDW